MNTVISYLSGLITGSINDVKNWILKIIQAVYSFISRQISNLEHDFTVAWNELDAFITSVKNFAVSVYQTLYVYIRSELSTLSSWLASVIGDIRNDINGIIHTVTGWVDTLAKTIASGLSDVVKWVTSHIYDPLYNLITGAVHWIEHEGAFIYDLVTHPDKLAALLGKYLWSSYLDLLKKYGKPIARWLLHSMLGLANEFADVLESILTALL